MKTANYAGTQTSEFGFERVVNFSDAVMAIAITLLAIEIRLPDLTSSADLVPALLDLWPRYLSFAISFAVIGAFWGTHHSMFLFIQRFDRRLMWLNLLFLALIAFMPFPTSVVGQYGDTPGGQIFYASSVAAIGLVRIIMWRHASQGRRLLAADIPPEKYRHITIRGLVGPSIFLMSIPFAFVHFAIPIVMWCLSLGLSALVRPAGHRCA